MHLVLDNASSHKARLVHDWLVKQPRWHLHFTPTSASWLNLVEGWFSLLTRRCLQRGIFVSTDSLKAAIQAYIEQTNLDPKPFIWTKSADEILASVKRFCQRTLNSQYSESARRKLRLHSPDAVVDPYEELKLAGGYLRRRRHSAGGERGFGA